MFKFRKKRQKEKQALTLSEYGSQALVTLNNKEIGRMRLFDNMVVYDTIKDAIETSAKCGPVKKAYCHQDARYDKNNLIGSHIAVYSGGYSGTDYARDDALTYDYFDKDQTNLLNGVLGLLEESAELATLVLNMIYDPNNQPANETVEQEVKRTEQYQSRKADAKHRDKILKEAGDVLWYLNLIATSYDFTFEDVARANLLKLRKRHTDTQSGKLEFSTDYKDSDHSRLEA